MRTYQDWSDSDPSTTARRLLFLGERGAKRIHIFKGSGIDSILTIVWFTMRRLKGVYVTFDSVTWLSEHYGDIHHPLIHAWVDDFKRVHNRSNIVPICGCPFCANLKYTSVPAIREGKRDYKYVMGYNNHNVWSLWFLIESLIEYSKSDEMYGEVVKILAKKPDDVMHAINSDHSSNVTGYE